MEWIFLSIVFVGVLTYEIIDRICESIEKTIEMKEKEENDKKI